jgi:hypothetical protein
MGTTISQRRREREEAEERRLFPSLTNPNEARSRRAAGDLPNHPNRGIQVMIEDAREAERNLVYYDAIRKFDGPPSKHLTGKAYTKLVMVMYEVRKWEARKKMQRRRERRIMFDEEY